MVLVFPDKGKANPWRYGCEDSVTYKQVGKTPRIFAVAGGKGGVGKTLTATMLGICLAGFQRKTLLVDLDFSGANLHGYLDLPDLKRSLNPVLTGKKTSLQEVIQPTFWKNLGAITLDSQTLSPESMSSGKRIYKRLRSLDVDYIILDVGTPTSSFALDAFSSAENRLVVTTNDRLSLHNTFTLIRSALLHRLKSAWYDCPQFLRALDNCAILTEGAPPQSLQTTLKSLAPENRKLLASVLAYCRNYTPKLVLNDVDDDEDLHELVSLGIVVEDILSVALDFWGSLGHDESIRRATRQNRPDKWFHPFGKMAHDVLKIVIRHIIAGEYGNPMTQTHLDSARMVTKLLNDETYLCSKSCLLWNKCPHQYQGESCLKQLENSRRLAD